MTPVRNPYAVQNAAKRKAREAYLAATEPMFAFYDVPRELIERVLARDGGGRWIDVVSEADLQGCHITRGRKRDMTGLVSPGRAIVYEGERGEIRMFQQGW